MPLLYSIAIEDKSITFLIQFPASGKGRKRNIYYSYWLDLDWKENIVVFVNVFMRFSKNVVVCSPLSTLDRRRPSRPRRRWRRSRSHHRHH